MQGPGHKSGLQLLDSEYANTTDGSDLSESIKLLHQRQISEPVLMSEITTELWNQKTRFTMQPRR